MLFVPTLQIYITWHSYLCSLNKHTVELKPNVLAIFLVDMEAFIW